MSLKIEEIEKGALYGLFVALVSLVGFLGSNQMGKLVEIEKQLVKIQVEIAELQSKMMTDERVRELIKLELLKEKKQ